MTNPVLLQRSAEKEEEARRRAVHVRILESHVVGSGLGNFDYRSVSFCRFPPQLCAPKER